MRALEILTYSGITENKFQMDVMSDLYTYICETPITHT